MKIVQADEVEWKRGLQHRGGTFHYRHLLNGTSGTLGNFQFDIGQLEGDFASPRHRHNFDQFRFQIEGTMNFARNGKMAAGTTVAIVNGDIPTAAASGAYEAGLFEAAGFKVVFNKGIVPINGASTNYTPYVDQIEASNPGVVFLSLDFASAAGLSAAFTAAGYKGVLYSPVGYSEGLLQAEPSIKAALQGEVVDSEFPAAEDNSAAVKVIASALKASGKTEPLGLGATIGYYDADMLVQMLQNAAKKGKPLTGAGITAAANSGFTYKVTAKGGACSQTYPTAHIVGTVGITLMQVEGTQYKLKVPYTCFKNVKAPSGS